VSQNPPVQSHCRTCIQFTQNNRETYCSEQAFRVSSRINGPRDIHSTQATFLFLVRAVRPCVRLVKAFCAPMLQSCSICSLSVGWFLVNREACHPRGPRGHRGHRCHHFFPFVHVQEPFIVTLGIIARRPEEACSSLF
jgi:hypothetical protein